MCSCLRLVYFRDMSLLWWDYCSGSWIFGALSMTSCRTLFIFLMILSLSVPSRARNLLTRWGCRRNLFRLVSLMIESAESVVNSNRNLSLPVDQLTAPCSQCLSSSRLPLELEPSILSSSHSGLVRSCRLYSWERKRSSSVSSEVSQEWIRGMQVLILFLSSRHSKRCYSYFPLK